YAVEAEQGPVTLGGYVADPACERGGTQMQYFFVNGRWVRDKLLAQALADAYRGLLMTGRYAIGFLFLDLPPDHLDVNVHPTKAEVRFRDPEQLQAFVTETVRSRLQGEDLTGRLRGPVTSERPQPPSEPTFDFATPPAPVPISAPEPVAPRPAPI